VRKKESTTNTTLSKNPKGVKSGGGSGSCALKVGKIGTEGDRVINIRGEEKKRRTTRP